MVKLQVEWEDKWVTLKVYKNLSTAKLKLEKYKKNSPGINFRLVKARQGDYEI